MSFISSESVLIVTETQPSDRRAETFAGCVHTRCCHLEYAFYNCITARKTGLVNGGYFCTWNADVSELQCSRTTNRSHLSAADSRLTNQLQPPFVGDSPLADSVLPRIRKEQQHRYHDDNLSTPAVNSSSARTTWRYVTVACCLQLARAFQQLVLNKIRH